MKCLIPPGPVTHSIIRVGDIQYTLRDEVRDLAVEGSLSRLVTCHEELSFV